MTDEIIESFDAMKELCGDRNLGVMVHDVDFDKLDKSWEIVGQVTESGDRFWSANSEKHVGLTLFERRPQ